MNRSHHLLSTLTFVVLAIGVGVLPFYNHGVFFPQGHAQTDIVLLSILSLYAVVRVGMWIATSVGIRSSRRINDSAPSSDGPSTYTFRVHTRLTRYDIAFGVYVLLYIASLFYAADLSLAAEGAMDAVALVLPYGLMRMYGNRGGGAEWMLAGIAVSSVVINVVGFANGWHQFSMVDAIVVSPHVQVSSVFQYHNAFAALCSAVTIGLLVYVSTQRRHWPRNVAYSGIIGLNLAGLILSGSRGALLFWVVILIAAVIGLRTREKTNEDRSRYVLYLVASTVGAAVGYESIHKGLVTADPTKGWLGIVLALIIPMILVTTVRLGFRTRSDGILKSRKTFPLVVVAGLVIAATLVFVKRHSLVAKLQTYDIHQMSVIQRFIFWKDGFHVIARDPLFGSGYGAWTAMFEKVESYSYYSTEVHSFVMDVLMNVGIVGFVAFAFLVWPLVRATVWPWQGALETTEVPVIEQSSNETAQPGTHGPILRAFSAFGLMLLLHACMDWDMAFLYLLLLFTLSLGAAVALRNHAVCTARTESTSDASARARIGVRSKAITLAATTCAALVALFGAVQTVRAQSVAAEAKTMPPDSTQAMLFQRAYRLDPLSASYLADEGMTYQQIATGSSVASNRKTALGLLKRAAQALPYNSVIQSEYATVAYDQGQFKLAYDRAVLSYHDAPFFPSSLSLAINAAAIDGMETAGSNPAQAKEIFHRVERLYQDYQHNLAIVKALPSYLPPLSPYTLDTFTYDSLAASYLALGEPKSALHFASTAASNKTQHTADLGGLIGLLASDQSKAVVESGHTPSLKPTQRSAIDKFIGAHPDVKSSYALLENLSNVGVAVK